MTNKELRTKLEEFEDDAEVLLTSEFLENEHELVEVVQEFRKHSNGGESPIILLKD